MKTAQHQDSSNPLVAYLENGERVLWEGKPHKVSFVFFTPPWAIYLVPFFVLWVGIGAGLMVFAGVRGGEHLPQYIAFLVPYTLAGVYLGFGRYLLALREWRNTYYLLTDRRVLIRRGVLTPRVEVVNLATLSHPTLHTGGNSLGSIDLGSGGAAFTISGWPSLGGSATPAILAVPQAQEVFKALRQTQQGTQRKGFYA